MTLDLRFVRLLEVRMLVAAGMGITILMVTVGCGGPAGPERTIVSGSVTYDGEPVQDGEIRFVPAEATAAPLAAAPIENGRYAVDSRGGVPVGTHKVEILGYKKNPNAAPLPDDIPGAAPREQYIPAKYNQQTELEVTVESDSGPITQDFQLEKPL